MRTMDRGMLSLYVFYAVNFIAVGMTTFSAKYQGEIGLSDSRIGLISAVTALAALLFQPAWGILADRARLKRTVLAVSQTCAGLMCFLVPLTAGRFLPLLMVLTAYGIFNLPAMPVSSAISLEYTARVGRGFGPVRMMGTIGYQVSILATGFLLTDSLAGLYPAMGCVLLLSAGSALLLPRVEGHQHSRGQKTSVTVFFRDRRLLLLFAVAFLANIGHQFNLAFFSKHLGDLGISNSVTGIITTCSVLLEIPFLFFGDRIMKRFSLWTWLTIGLGVGAVRFLLLSVVTDPVWIVPAQALSISQLACFEFFPSVWLGRVTRSELQASAQSVYQIITFGIARIAASLLGGVIADAAGIPRVYALCGALMALTAGIFFLPMRRQAAKEKNGDAAA